MKLAYSDSEKWLSDNGYAKHPRYTYDKYGGTYRHRETKKEVDVQHYPKAGVSYIDNIDKDGNITAESVIYGMLATHLFEGTAGDTNLVDAYGKLTHRGYAAMYAWKKAGHKGLHPSIANERAIKVVKPIR